MASVRRTQAGKVSQKEEALREARQARNYSYDWKIDGQGSEDPRGKVLIEAKDLNFAWPDSDTLWAESLNFQIHGGERLLLQGDNGSGKSSLLRLLTEDREGQQGSIRRNTRALATLDQHLGFLQADLSLIENFQRHFRQMLPEHELRIRLGRFRFEGEEVFRKAGSLSGGERMRLALACVLASDQVPELLLLDEPTNHLDLRSKGIFTGFLQQYRGAMVLVSHDPQLAEDLGADRVLTLQRIPGQEEIEEPTLEEE